MLCVFTACGETNTLPNGSGTNQEQIIDDNGGGDDNPTSDHKHVYSETIVNATCTEQGYTLHKCSCGYEYKDNYTNALEHEFTNYVYDNNATYDEDGTKTAYCNHGCGATNTLTAENTKLKSGIIFKTMTVDGNNVSKTIPNVQAEFDFLEEIERKGNATYTVSENISGSNPIESKTVEPATGENRYYILVKINGELESKYTVTIYRRHIFTVSFNADGGTAVSERYVEEDSLTTEPTTTKAGYTFNGWDYDFTTPITKNTTVTASWVYYTLTTGVNSDKAGTITVYDETKITVGEEITVTATTNDGYTFNGWYDGDNLLTNELSYTFTMSSENLSYTVKWTANTNTKYTIEHYLEELDGSFTKQESDTAEKYGETDTLATVQATDIKEYEHFTHATVGQSVERANLNGDESTVLKVYYSRNRYTIRFVAGGNVTLNKWYDGEYKYGYQIESVTATFNGYLGYDEWIGWHNGDNVLTYEKTIPSFKVDKDMDYTADFSIKPEISNFYFTSDAETCIITGVKDKTITEIIVPNFVTSIGTYAFRNYTSLTEITIPDSITSIGNFAFSGCDNLIKIYYTGSINDWASKISGLGELMRYGTADKVLYINNVPVTEIVLEGITKIQSHAFYKTNINSLTILGNLTSIGNSAFSGCVSLANVTLGSSVGSIDDSAFRGCSGLTSIIIPDGVGDIGADAFRGCSGLTSIMIPDGVKYIGFAAFENCSSLTSVKIGKEVTIIPPFLFSNCSSLTIINFNGTKEQWSEIEKGDYWRYNVPSSCIAHFADGTEISIDKA